MYGEQMFVVELGFAFEGLLGLIQMQKIFKSVYRFCGDSTNFFISAINFSVGSTKETTSSSDNV